VEEISIFNILEFFPNVVYKYTILSTKTLLYCKNAVKPKNASEIA
jgi:hypothetical protein